MGNQSGATFPGYISILNGAAEKENWSGDEGRFRELERLIRPGWFLVVVAV